MPHFLCSRVAPAVLDNPRHRGEAGSRVGLLLLSTENFADGFYNFMLCNFGVSGEVAVGVGQSVLLELGHWSGELMSTE